MSAPQIKSGKQRSSLIERDYYRHPDGLQRMRKWVTVAVCTCLFIILAAFALTGNISRHASHGPVASVHASWEQDCQVCHRPFVPVRDDAWAHQLVSKSQDSEQLCSRCHVAGSHHQIAMTGDGHSAERCATCHREHRGRSAQLTAVDDDACLRCHSRLDAVRVPSKGLSSRAIESKVAAFALKGGHPEFRSLEEDPGQIRFHHALHMSPGLAGSSAMSTSRAQWRWDDPMLRGYSGPLRDRNAADRDLVQLSCDSCHEPEGTGAGGELMARVRFEQHCELCHPLRYEAGNAAATVPHRRTFPQLKEYLEREYLARIVGELPDASVKVTPGRPIPGKDRLGPDLVPVELRQQLAKSVSDAMRYLQHEPSTADRTSSVAGCAMCHMLRRGENVEETKILPSNIPSSWFRHARFSHRAHQFDHRTGDALNCLSCHSWARTGFPEKRDEDVVMIAGKDTCVECHSPRSDVAGGIRYDCVLCHQYHAVLEPLP